MKKLLLNVFKLLTVMTVCIAVSVFMMLTIQEADKVVNDPYTKYSGYIHPIQVQHTITHPITGQTKKIYPGGTAFRVKLGNKIYLMTAAHICSPSDTGTAHVVRGADDKIKDDDGREELKILKVDETKDLCLIEGFKESKDKKYQTGLEIEDKSLPVGSKALYIGYPEGFHLYLGEGRYMGQKIIHVLEHPKIDHEKLNEFIQYQLPIEEKERICKKHGKNNKLVKQAEVEGIHPYTGQYIRAEYHSCLMGMQLAKFSFMVSKGASGSPVINPVTGKLLSVVIIRDEGYMGYGLTPLKTDLIDFVKEYNK